MNTIFPLIGTITYDIVEEAHKRILKIAIEVKRVLQNHNIPYSIFFGTVIGSVRHKGFIPWDMDMDMGIFDNYDEVVRILKEELPSWIVVLDNQADSNYCASWVKIVDRYSEFHATTFSGDNIYKYKGLHVDLYNIKRTSYNNACSYRKQEALDYYKKRLDLGLITSREYQCLSQKAQDTYEKELSQRTLLEEDIPEYVFLKFFEAKEDAIFPLKPYEFEGEWFLGPNDYDMFLKSCYYKGNYMELPPYEKRDMKMDEIIIKPIK